jgi:hypothetical protein
MSGGKESNLLEMNERHFEKYFEFTSIIWAKRAGIISKDGIKSVESSSDKCLLERKLINLWVELSSDWLNLIEMDNEFIASLMSFVSSLSK